jgi:hypothetical protein
VGTEEYLPDQSSGAITNSVHRSMAIEPLWVIARIQDAELNATADPMLAAQKDAFAAYPYTAANPSPKLPPDDPTSTDRPYAWGFFDTLYPDANGVCTATLNASDIVLPDIPAHTWTAYDYSTTPPSPTTMMQDDQPETHLRYEWRNVQVVQKGPNVGQLAFADLTITRDGCQAQYHVALLSPQTTCNSTMTDANGNPLPDVSQCSPTAVPDVPSPTIAQLYGTGLPAGVPVECKDLNAAPASADAGTAGGGSTPDWECVPTQTAP